MFQKPQLFRSKILAIKEVAYDTLTYVFQKPKDMDYKAGQYMRLILHHVGTGERDSRYFTFSSAPFEKTLQITVKIKPSKFKEALYKLKVGDELEYFAPIGVFCLDSNQGKYIMLAGGVGMTPFYSMIKEFRHKKAFVDIFYLASYQTTADILFEDELREMGVKSKGHIKVWHTLTRHFPESARKHIFDFQETLLREAKGMGDPIWMVSGSTEFVDAVGKWLIELGLPKDRVFTETFL